MIWRHRFVELETIANRVQVGHDSFTARRVVVKREAMREVDVSLCLDHPAFRRVRGHVRAEDWAAFDHVEGTLLDDATGEASASGDPRALAVELLRALVHLHAAGFAHTDLKPSNVLIGSHLHVIDLEMAVPLGARPLGGTPGYVAPELAGGAGASVAADLFAFGALFVKTAPKKSALRVLCEQCLRDDPARRPASAESCLAALHASARPIDRARMPIDEVDTVRLPRDGSTLVVEGASGYLLPHLAHDDWRRGVPVADLRFGAADPWVALTRVADVNAGDLCSRVAAAAPASLVLIEGAGHADADARDAMTTLATVLRTRARGGMVVLDPDPSLCEALQRVGAERIGLPSWGEAEVRQCAESFGVRSDPRTLEAILETSAGAPARARTIVQALASDPSLHPADVRESDMPLDPADAPRAVEKAVRAGAGRRALGHLESMSARTRKSISIELRADAHTLAGELERAIELERRPRSAQRRMVVADRLLRLGRWQDASDHARRAAEDDESLQGEALHVRATALREQGNLDDAEALASEPAQHPWSVHLTLIRSDIATARGKHAESLRLAEVGLAAALDDTLRALAHARIAASKAAAGDWRNARSSYAAALELFERTGDLTRWPAYVMNVATADHALGDLGAAIRGYEAASDLAERLERPVTLAAAATNLASLLLAIGAHDDARAVLGRARSASDSIDYAIYGALCRLIEAELDGLSDRARGIEGALEARDAFDALGATKQALEATLVAIGFGHALELDREALESAGLIDRLWTIDARRALDEGQAALASELAERAARAAGERGARLHELEALDILARSRGGADDARRAADARATIAGTLPPGLRARFEAPSAPASGPMGSNAKRILRLARRVLLERDVQRLYAFALDEAVALTGAERAFLLERVPKRRPRVVVARNIDKEHVRKSRFRFSRSVAEKVLDSGEPFMTARAADDPELQGAGSVHAMGLRSILAMPVHSPTSVVAALYLDHRFSEATFGPHERELLSALADLLGLAIENARLHAAAEQRHEELRISEQAARAESARRAEELVRLESEVGRGGSTRGGLVARSPAMIRALDLVDRAASTDLTVLIEGESGTGKELVARRVHERSPRRERAMLAINCAALTETLLESELFGHARGAFTGAVRDNPGLFRAATGGTLLLDEIGEMPMRMQTRLLRVLQERRVRPVGAEREVDVDVRVVAATNRDLAAEVEAGRFRRDLFFRLAAVRVQLPPLRERVQAIPELVTTLLERIAGEPGMRAVSVGRKTLTVLMQHDWPGNVRELEQVLRRAVLMADGDELLPEHVALGGAGPTRRMALERFDAQLVADALRAAGGNKSRAARALGVSRPTLYRWLDRYGLR